MANSVDPKLQYLWEHDIEHIRRVLARQDEFLVSTGIGDMWSTYIRKPSGSLKRITSRFLPQRARREDAERDLYAWLLRGIEKCGGADGEHNYSPKATVRPE